MGEKGNATAGGQRRFRPLAAWNGTRARRGRQALTLGIVLALLWPNLTWAFESSVLVSTRAAGSRGPIEIPQTLGTVLRHAPGNGPKVILLQDLHCNFAVQRKIAGIIDLLARQDGLRLVAVEGAFRTVDPGKLASFPIPEVRAAVGEHLLKQGRLSGAEWYAALGGRPIRLEGVDDERLYRASRECMTGFFTDENAGHLSDLRAALETLKCRVFSIELVKFDSLRVSRHDGVLSAMRYCTRLKEHAVKLGLATGDLMNVERYLGGGKSELPPEVEWDALAAEMEKLDLRVRERLYATADERELDELFSRLNRLESLLSVSIAPQDLAQVRAKPEAYRSGAFTKFLGHYDIALLDEVGADIGQLDHALELALEFYRLADARSSAFVERTVSTMRAERANQALLVVGGYHAPVLQEELLRRGIDCVVIKPRLDGTDGANPYFDLLERRRNPMAKLLDSRQPGHIALPTLLAEFAPDGAVISEEQLPADRQEAYRELEGELKFGALGWLTSRWRGARSRWREAYAGTVKRWTRNRGQGEPDISAAEIFGDSLLVPVQDGHGFAVVTLAEANLGLPSAVDTLPIAGREISFYPNPMKNGLREKLRDAMPRRARVNWVAQARRWVAEMANWSLAAWIRRLAGRLASAVFTPAANWARDRVVRPLAHHLGQFRLFGLLATAYGEYAAAFVHQKENALLTQTALRFLSGGRTLEELTAASAKTSWLAFFIWNVLIGGALPLLLVPVVLPASAVKRGLISPGLGAVFLIVGGVLAGMTVMLLAPLAPAVIVAVGLAAGVLVNLGLILRSARPSAPPVGLQQSSIRVIPVFTAILGDIKLAVGLLPILQAIGPGAVSLPWMFGSVAVILVLLGVSAIAANIILGMVREQRVYSLGEIWNALRGEWRGMRDAQKRWFSEFRRSRDMRPGASVAAVLLVLLARVFEYGTALGFIGSLGVLPYIGLGLFLVVTGYSLIHTQDKTVWLETMVSRSLRLIVAVILVDILKLPALLVLPAYAGSGILADQLTQVSLRMFKKVFGVLSLAELLLVFANWFNRMRRPVYGPRPAFLPSLARFARSLTGQVRAGFGPGQPMRQAVIAFALSSLVLVSLQLGLPLAAMVTLQIAACVLMLINWFKLARNPKVSQQVRIMTLSGFLPVLVILALMGVGFGLVGVQALWPQVLPAVIQSGLPQALAIVTGLQSQALEAAAFISFIYSLWSFSGVMRDADRYRRVSEAAPDRVQALDVEVRRLLDEAVPRLRPDDTIGPDRLRPLFESCNLRLIARRYVPEWAQDDLDDGVFTLERETYFREDVFRALSDRTAAILLFRERLIQAGMLPIQRVHELVQDVTGVDAGELNALVQSVLKAQDTDEAIYLGMKGDPNLRRTPLAARAVEQRRALERIFKWSFSVPPDAYAREFGGSWVLLNDKLRVWQRQLGRTPPHPYLLRYSAERIGRAARYLQPRLKSGQAPTLRECRAALAATAEPEAEAEADDRPDVRGRRLLAHVLSPLRRLHFHRPAWPERIWQGLLSALVFGPADEAVGVRPLRRPWKWAEGFFRGAGLVLQAPLRVWGALQIQAPFEVDDHNPELTALQRRHRLPDGETVEAMRAVFGYAVQPVRIRPLPPARGRHRFAGENWLGRYDAAGTDGLPTVYLPAGLLRALLAGEPRTDAALGSRWRWLVFALRRYWLGLLLSHHARRYYAGPGLDDDELGDLTAAGMIGEPPLPDTPSPRAHEVKAEPEPAISMAPATGWPAAEIYAAASPRSGLSVFDWLRLTDEWLAEAQTGRQDQAADAEAGLAERLAELRRQGAEPGLAALAQALATLPETETSPRLSVLRQALIESEQLPRVARSDFMQDALAYYLQCIQARSQPGAADGAELAEAVEPREVFLLALPATCGALLARVDAALAAVQPATRWGRLRERISAAVDIRPSSRASRQALAERVARLQALRSALAAGAQAEPGAAVPLAPEIGRMLWSGAVRSARSEAPQALPLGLTLDGMRVGLASGGVTLREQAGVTFATRVLVEWSGQAWDGAGLTAAQPLPTEGLSRVFSGEEAWAAPADSRPAGGPTLLRLMRWTQILPERWRAAVNRFWFRIAPWALIQSAAVGSPSRLADFLADPSTPVAQAGLRWLAHPDEASERAWAYSLVLVLQGISDPAEQSRALATISLLAERVPGLAGVRLAHWTAAPSRTAAGIWIPGVLLRPGNSGVLGALTDILRPLPVDREGAGMEQRRRRHLLDASQAA